MEQQYSTSEGFSVKPDGLLCEIPKQVILDFRADGFAVFPEAVSSTTVSRLNDRLEEVLRGRFDRDSKPDKAPRRLKSEYVPLGHKPRDKKPRGRGEAAGPLGFSGNYENVKVLQVINVHKADHAFRELATSPSLGRLVAQLAGWEDGARLAQDQVWAKPPNAPPLSFHRDSPYFMFSPPDVVTVWVALDDMDEEIGPLEYVRGSHQWGDGRIGSSNTFFDEESGKSLLYSAASRAGVTDIDICSMKGLQAGGISIHDGRTWHGSGRNSSKSRPRRGLGIHFVPNNVHFTKEATKSSLWRSYIEGSMAPESVALSEEEFPSVWSPAGGS